MTKPLTAFNKAESFKRPSARFGQVKTQAKVESPGMVFADFCAGDFPADGSMHEARWINTTGKTLYVRKALPLVGPQIGVVADISNIIYRLSDHMVVAMRSQDASFYRGDGDYSRPDEWNRGELEIAPGDGFFNRCYSVSFKDNPIFGIPAAQAVTGFRCFVWLVE